MRPGARPSHLERRIMAINHDVDATLEHIAERARTMETDVILTQSRRDITKNHTAATAADMPDLERLADLVQNFTSGLVCEKQSPSDSVPRIVRIDVAWGDRPPIHLESPLTSRADWLKLLRAIHQVLDEVTP